MVAVQQETRSRERILTTARDLFATAGFHQTSMAHLASAANVSVGLIYRSFKGKEDIIQAIVDVDMTEFLEDLDGIRRRCEAGVISVEQAFNELFESRHEKKDEALSFEILAEGFRNDKVRDVIEQSCGSMRQLLRGFARAANPKLSDQSLDSAEEFMLATLFGLNHSSLSRPKLDRETAKRKAAAMTIIALRGME